jgi:DNA-binding FrmR family transcriptional regulator
VALELLRNHLRHCAAHALHGGPEQSAAMVEELVALTKRFAR